MNILCNTSFKLYIFVFVAWKRHLELISTQFLFLLHLLYLYISTYIHDCSLNILSTLLSTAAIL